MRSISRRGFLAASAAAPLAPGLGFLAPLSRLAAADRPIGPDPVRRTTSIDDLVELIRSTPRARLIPVFVGRLQAGLSYQDFLGALFLATVEHGDPHQVAGVYSAHRVSSEARIEERLLSLFWALDRIGGGFEEKDWRKPEELRGELPRDGEAADVFGKAMVAQDAQSAERAILVLSRALGHRQTLGLLWEHSARRASGTLGHHPIMAANTWRTLEALGWEHSEPVLRYLARSFATSEADRTWLPNLARARRTLVSLPAGWTAAEPNRGATLELYATLRDGKTDAACDLACEQLSRGVRAGAVWDAVHLVAADLLFRYRTGGTVVGSYLVHAVTSTNALRCGFDSSGEDRVRLLLLLQAVAVLGELFVTTGEREDQLRSMSLLDLKAGGPPAAVALDEVFAMLPGKTGVPCPDYPASARTSSDEASRLSFALLQEPAAQAAFRQAARSLLCVKATGDPHDLKYPVAAFEDARSASPEWRPYLLASSVHALHGPASADSAVLVAAREALR